MAFAQRIEPFRASAPQRLATIAIVAGIHIAIIAALVIALVPHYAIPPLPGPLHVAIDKVAPRLPANEPAKPILFKLTTREIPPPIVDIVEPQDRQTITPAPPPSSGATQVGSDMFVAARGVAATHTIPDYPPLAVRLNEQGIVTLKLGIDETGGVVDAAVAHSSGYSDLDEAAVAWVKAHWRYEPATRNGKPVSTTAMTMVTFRLIGG